MRLPSALCARFIAIALAVVVCGAPISSARQGGGDGACRDAVAELAPALSGRANSATRTRRTKSPDASIRVVANAPEPGCAFGRQSSPGNVWPLARAGRDVLAFKRTLLI